MITPPTVLRPAGPAGPATRPDPTGRPQTSAGGRCQGRDDVGTGLAGHQQAAHRPRVADALAGGDGLVGGQLEQVQAGVDEAAAPVLGGMFGVEHEGQRAQALRTGLGEGAAQQVYAFE